MSTSAAARPLHLPILSYGPFRLLEAVPWLMLAAALRLLSYTGGWVAVPALIGASVALFLAFLLATRRIIELGDGRTGLGALDFGGQLRLTQLVLARVVLLLVLACATALICGAPLMAPHFAFGFDGIAFNQDKALGMLWSSLLAAVVLLLVIQASNGETVALRAATREFIARWRHLVPAIGAVAAFQVGISVVQHYAHWLLWIFWQTSSLPVNLKNLIYFAVIVAFAAVRLWVTLAILTLALRRSQRRSRPPGPTPAST